MKVWSGSLGAASAPELADQGSHDSVVASKGGVEPVHTV